MELNPHQGLYHQQEYSYPTYQETQGNFSQGYFPSQHTFVHAGQYMPPGGGTLYYPQQDLMYQTMQPPLMQMPPTMNFYNEPPPNIQGSRMRSRGHSSGYRGRGRGGGRGRNQWQSERGSYQRSMNDPGHTETNAEDANRPAVSQHRGRSGQSRLQTERGRYGNESLKAVDLTNRPVNISTSEKSSDQNRNNTIECDTTDQATGQDSTEQSKTNRGQRSYQDTRPVRGEHRKYETGRRGVEGRQYSGPTDRSAQRRGASTRGNIPGRGKGGGYKKNWRDTQDDETQRGALIEQLSKNSYECMICCENVKHEAAVWSCCNCYHIFHLRCVKKWARSPAASVEGEGTGWRCPACQNVEYKVPYEYRCYCGKMRNPDFTRYDTPHSCGEVCGKKRGGECQHPCNILCHPGPCPPCHASVVKYCDCGRSKQTVKCSQAASLKCTQICGKTLNCGKHDCQVTCHPGPCSPCEAQLHQECCCGKTSRDIICGTAESFIPFYCCEQVCSRALECGNHSCDKECHPGPCQTCALLPSLVTHCPCGATALADLTPEGSSSRKSCLDPVPTCDHQCGKPLPCGPADDRHTCKMSCHEGACGPCEGTTELTCRCGALDKEMSCQEAAKLNESDGFKCDKRCNKKRHCGRHRCGQQCCVDTEHKCDLICGHKLTCGLHRCEEPCHRGNCPACWQVSFDELACECGAEVMFPPIPCGTRPPECRRPCTRQHTCDHPVRHNCHSDERCPPCTQLTEKWCMGGHELRRNIPCHLSDISCGLPCNKDLSCAMHQCLQVCHKGPCMAEGQTCSQPCLNKREACDHMCGAPCHSGQPCPPIACKAEVILKCKCGNRSQKAQCLRGGEKDMAQDYQRLTTSMLATKMQDIQAGNTVDISNLATEVNRTKPRQLECTEECAVIERNRRVALALEIKNPDLQGKLGQPPFSQALKDFARQSTSFVAGVEKALSELVKSAQSSKQLKRSHAFPPMNYEQRKLIHELAEFYGCETQSYDQEPKKNVVVTAYKNKCWHASVTLTSVVQREMHPKAPIPIPHRGKESNIRSAVQAAKQTTHVMGAWGNLVPLTSSSTKAAASRTAVSSKKTDKTDSSIKGLGSSKTDAPVDYFDMT